MVTYLDGTAIWGGIEGVFRGVVTPVFTYQENKIKVQLYPTSAVHPSFMASPKFTKLAPHSNLLSPAGAPSPMG